MQVFSPTGVAPGASGLSATAAFANPGATSNTDAPVFTSSLERLVGGSERAKSARVCWACAGADTARLAAKKKRIRQQAATGARAASPRLDVGRGFPLDDRRSPTGFPEDPSNLSFRRRPDC